jgi:hypothetical protein
MGRHIRRNSQLRIVKLAHTVVWAVFASCVLAIPVYVVQNRIDRAFLLICVVSLEVIVLCVNSWRCPLTAVAARYTDNRRDNFDIYLPNWLARFNKLIFGTIFAAGILFTIIRWRMRLA